MKLKLIFYFIKAFFYLFKNGSPKITSFNNLIDSIIYSFQMTFGEFKDRVDEFHKIQYSVFIKIVFVTLMIILHILLLSMLIAMMGNTYQHIIRRSQREWKRQWAHIVLLLERTFSAKELIKYQQEYCIKLSKNENNEEQLALLVIKTASKTKALQKRNAIINWKKIGKKLFTILREKKCEPELLFNRPETPIDNKIFNKKEFLSYNKEKSKKKEKITEKDDQCKGSKQLRTTRNKAFIPNSINRIYPTMSQSLSSICRQQTLESPLNNDFEFISENNISKLTQSNKYDDLAYIKNETLPRFPVFHLFSKKNDSETSSANELLKEQISTI